MDFICACPVRSPLRLSVDGIVHRPQRSWAAVLRHLGSKFSFQAQSVIVLTDNRLAVTSSVGVQNGTRYGVEMGGGGEVRTRYCMGYDCSFEDKEIHIRYEVSPPSVSLRFG